MSKKKNKPELDEFFYLKPKLTLAMKLAASFALTYYTIMLAYYVLATVFYRYSIDFYYLGRQSVYQNKYIDIIVLASGLLLSTLLVLSLILILCKKTYWKAVFVVGSLLLILYQLFTTSLHPWMKYALEILLVLVITPLRIKKIMKTEPQKDKNNQNPEDSQPEKVQEQNQVQTT